MRSSFSISGALVAAALSATPAAAVETLATEELASHCRHYPSAPDGEDGIFCVRYIQGFIDGAVATDERVTNNVANEYDGDETFTERAIRTRVIRRLRDYGPSYYAEFCLGEPVPLAEVVEHVVAELEDPALVDQHPTAREFVYASLRSHYACDPGDSP